MKVESVLCMNSGDGETSYANNSLLQKIAISKARPVLESTIKTMFQGTLPKCISIADLGCASGPNTLFVVTDIMETIYEMSKQRDCTSPEFFVFLNDLPENDFNIIFKKLPAHYDNIKKAKGEKFGPYFVSGVPGSFYERLFPSGKLHFIHSSYSIQWLSKVPDGLESNKGNICIARTSPPDVYRAYHEQFQRDFTRFLSMRSEELVQGGRMVLTFLGRSTIEPTSNDCCAMWELLSKSLLDLVVEGLVEEETLESFNMPVYTAHQDEVRKIIKDEGSFNLDKLEIFEINWDLTDDINDKDFVFNKHKSSRVVASCIRAVMEPIFSANFGVTIMDNLFSKYRDHVADHLCMDRTKYVTIVIAVSKKRPKEFSNILRPKFVSRVEFDQNI